MEGECFDHYSSLASQSKTGNVIFNMEISTEAERNFSNKAVPDLQPPQHFLGLSRVSRLQPSGFSAPHLV